MAPTAPTSSASLLASTRRTLALAAAGALAAIAPLLLLQGQPFWVNVLSYTYLFAGLAMAWSIMAGFAGQFSLGHGVFFARCLGR